MTQVVTHRGLDASKENYFFESSFEAFQDQLNRGYGLEFDVRVTKDNQFVIVHDKTLKRISGGMDERLVDEATGEEIFKMELNGCRLTDLDTLCSMIAASKGNSISALHLKHESQTEKVMDAIIETFKKYNLFERCIVFDATIEAASYLKQQEPRFHIAASVAHEYDKERYNGAVGGTLYTLEELITNKDLFDWVWLDEWDLTDRNGGEKILYNKDIFEMLRKEGINIGLVTPELHGTSPALLGGEAHQDAADKTRLFNRIQNIIALKPDLVCTDYPDQVREMIAQSV